jgi:hypothetical protein
MAQGNPFYKGTVQRTDKSAADVVGGDAITLAGIADVLDRVGLRLDQLIAGQTSRHERAIFAKQVVATIGLELEVYTEDQAAPVGRRSKASEPTQLPTKDSDPVGYAKHRIAELTRRGQRVPREFVLIADGTASSWSEATKMAKAERQPAKATPAPKPSKKRTSRTDPATRAVAQLLP